MSVCVCVCVCVCVHIRAPARKHTHTHLGEGEDQREHDASTDGIHQVANYDRSTQRSVLRAHSLELGISDGVDGCTKHLDAHTGSAAISDRGVGQRACARQCSDRNAGEEHSTWSHATTRST